MKKLLVAVAVIGLLCAAGLTIHADDTVTDKKAFRKEMLEKYDTNKDGKLDKDEKAKMSKEDKDKWDKTFAHHKKSDASTSTNAPAATK
jgi:hypothetical protein